MNQSVKNLSSEIENLSSILLSTLDEQIFFGELSKFFKMNSGAHNVLLFKVLDDASAQLVAMNDQTMNDGIIIEKGLGLTGHVIRTKRPYFSNSIKKDPLFINALSEKVEAELCIPIAHEGIVIGTIHLQSNSVAEKEFSRDDINNVLEILKQLQKPVSNMKMYMAAQHLNRSLLKKIEEKERELEEKKSGLQIADTFKVEEGKMIGNSEEMKKVFSLVEKIADKDVSALIKGEIGTGKKLIAKRIHCRSFRKTNSFVSVDCSAFTESELEIELFGKENTNFAEGHSIKIGLVERANGGTLYLEEVSTLSANLQAKLYRLLKDGMTFRIGGQVPYRSNIRILSSTSKDLLNEVEAGNFREDLFFAINTVSIEIPSLKERKDDIEVLATHFLNKNKAATDHKSFAPGALKAITDYSWPGNIMELINIVERAYVLADGAIVEKTHLSDAVINGELAQNDEKDEQEVLLFSEMTLEELEKRHICQTLDHLSGNKTKTAKSLGITVKTLYNKLHSYDMVNIRELN